LASSSSDVDFTDEFAADGTALNPSEKATSQKTLAGPNTCARQFMNFVFSLPREWRPFAFWPLALGFFVAR
jgi:hypothetical protein